MPSFTIEAPGEAAPLTANDLYHVLAAAVSGNQVQVQASTKQLQAWETTPTFHSLLQDLVLEKSLPHQVRFLSVITLKNGVDKYWRKTANNALRPEERDHIRSRLMHITLTEDNSQISGMNSVIAAKIARYDFPAQWLDLIPSLCETLRTSLSSPDQLARILNFTHFLLKELATIRIQRPRAALYIALPELFLLLSKIHQSHLVAWQKSIAEGGDVLQSARLLSTCNYTLKILRRALLAGFEAPHRAAEVVEFLNMLRAQLSQHIDNLSKHPELGRQIILISKIYVALASNRPMSFAFLPDAPDLVHVYFSTAVIFRRHQIDSVPDTAEVETLYEFYEAFNLRALQLVRACFRMIHSHASALASRSNNEEIKKAKEIVKTEILSEAFISEVFDGIRNNFFILQESDIEEWFNEAEEWEMKEEEDDELAENVVRPAAERVFLEITIHYKDSVVGPITETLQHALQANNDMRQLDAALTTITVAAAALSGRLDFNSLLRNHLAHEVQRPREDAHIIRRRIAILLAKWSPIDIAAENKQLVYQIYRFLLDPEQNTTAVRIAAGKHISDVLMEFGFNGEAFAPYGRDVIGYLIGLIGEVGLPATKMALLSSLSNVVERMDSTMVPMADQIVSMLPSLWEEAEDEHLMMQRIVALLASLVGAMKASSAPLHPHVLPIIRDALEPGTEKHTWLLEDALDLLANVLAQTIPPASPDLLSLLPLCLPILDTDTEDVEKTLSIVESYLLLEPNGIISDDTIRRQLITAISPGVSSKKINQVHGSSRCINLMLRAAEALHGSTGTAALMHELASPETGSLLPKALECIHTTWQRGQTTGPNQQEQPADWRSETEYFVLLARLILSRADFFAELTGSEEGQKQVLEEWFAHMDQVSDPLQGKMLCMAVTKLLETRSEIVLGKLQDLMSLWTTMVIDLRDEQSADAKAESLVAGEEEVEASTCTSPEELRKAKMERSEVTRKVRLADWIKHHLLEAVATSGGQEKFQERWLVNVDKEVVKSFQALDVV